jgi:ParB family transcriptional regulator, chromosome partitioning protein
MAIQLKHLPIEQLNRGKYQPRQSFEQKALDELARSIKSQGLIEPIIVRATKDNTYEIIAGERRWRAAQLAGLTEIPCLLGQYSNEQAAAVTLIENIQRQDLNVLEEAGGYQRLCDEFHFHQDEIATLVGKSRSHIANCLRLLSLCPAVLEHLKNNTLSAGHARLLIGLPTSQQVSISEKIIKLGLSVRQVEREVKQLKQAPVSKKDIRSGNQDLLNLQTHLSEQLGAPVEIASSDDQSGWVKIKYYDNDTLSGLLQRLGLSYD